MKVFLPADMMLPQVESIEKWAVIACDQFTSQPEYWERVREKTGKEPSALELILPEAVLAEDNQVRIEKIHDTMDAYLRNDIFKTFKKSYIYVERKLSNGSVRKGLVGVVDLEAYDYHIENSAAVRVTEKTVEERIPPRMKIRQGASLELSHVLLLCDDEERIVIESLSERKEVLPKLYDFELMEGGGHIEGWLVQGEAVDETQRRLERYARRMADKYPEGANILFAVGDGNHSLASAKACYEELKKKYPDRDFQHHPARYAMVELENIHDEVQQFEAIHRIVKKTNPEELLTRLQEKICAEEGDVVTWYAGERSGTIILKKEEGELPIGVLQQFLDEYLAEHAGRIDYIHGDDTLKELACEEGAIGFLLPALKKERLFKEIILDGVLPRKTFSMGHAREKRYYLEARKIR